MITLNQLNEQYVFIMYKTRSWGIRGASPTSIANTLSMFSKMRIVRFSDPTCQHRPIVKAEQRLRFSRHFSDHLLADFNLQKHSARVRSLNTMMQATGRNTAFVCRFKIMSPNFLDSDIQEVRECNEIWLIRTTPNYEILFCNRNGEVEKQLITNPSIQDTLNSYEIGKYIEHEEHVQFINGILPSLGSRTLATGYVETDEEYITRYTRILDALNHELRNSDSPDTDIEILALQEAPIKQHVAFVVNYINAHFPDKWKINNQNVTYDTTRWGIFTLIRHNPSKTTRPILDTALTKNIPVKDIDVRCRTFYMFTYSKKLIKLTNLHLPHGDPETAFISFMTNVVKELMQKGSTKHSLHKVFGDFNIDTRRQDLLIRDIVHQEIQAAPKGTVFPFHFSTEILSSHEGHLKRNKQKISVDACVTFEIQPAEAFSFTSNIKEVDKYALSSLAVLASSLFVGIAAFDDEEIIEPESQSSMSPGF